MNKKVIVILAAVAALLAVIVTVGIIVVRSHRVVPGGAKPPRKISRPHRAPAHAMIAIVLDDFGYTSRNFEILSQIQLPLTLSVLPNLPFSRTVGDWTHDRFEIILHLPMEPKETRNLEADTIRTSMDEATIRDILDRDLANLKYARGVSNHMGSKVTEDAATLQRVFIELKNRGIFFLDSMVTPKSAAATVAQATGIRWARRDVFLDNRLDPSYIKAQLAILAQKARKNGSAVGIGHDRTVTLEVLREEMPRLAAEGYQFVFVSDLLN